MAVSSNPSGRVHGAGARAAPAGAAVTGAATDSLLRDFAGNCRVHLGRDVTHLELHGGDLLFGVWNGGRLRANLLCLKNQLVLIARFPWLYLLSDKTPIRRLASTV